MPDRGIPALASVGVAAVLGVLAAGATAAPAKPAEHGPLSPRLAVLSRGTFAKASPQRRAQGLSLPARGAGSLVRDGGRYVVEIRASGSTAGVARRLDRLAGVRVLGRSARYATVTAAVRLGALHPIADQPGVQAVTEQLAPIVSGAPAAPAERRAPVCQGAATSEGDEQLRANLVKSRYGDYGGVNVGILSDSFDRNTAAVTRAADDVASGDLPGHRNPCGRKTPVLVADDSAPGEDEGRAMLQIVHDLAPQAALGFATGTAPTGETGLASNIVKLADDGAKVIADDITYFDEPFFQDGPVSVAVNKVAKRGVAYFSSATNENLIDAHGNDIASWETPAFRDGGACGGPLTGLHCLDFNPGSPVDKRFGITIAPGATLKVDLQYAEPWYGVADDLDLFILDQADNSILASSTNYNLTTQKPFEFATYQNSTAVPVSVELAVNHYSGTGEPRVKFVLAENGGGVSATEYPVSNGGDIVGPTIFGHNGAANAISVGAVPYGHSNQIQSYSSRGPVTLYFGPVNGTTPAASIKPKQLEKPDIVASDCVQTTFFAAFTGGVWRFCGTSASTPHAAAVAALELAQNPGATVERVKSAMTSTARRVGSFGTDAAGAGLIDAAAAVRKIDAAPPGRARILKHPKRVTNRRKATFRLKASGAVGYECKLDRGNFKRCANPFEIRVKRGRKHTLEVRGLDNVGKAGTVSERFSWRVTG